MEHNPAELEGGVAIDGEGGSAAATVCAAGAGRAARGARGAGPWSMTRRHCINARRSPPPARSPLAPL